MQPGLLAGFLLGAFRLMVEWLVSLLRGVKRLVLFMWPQAIALGLVAVAGAGRGKKLQRILFIRVFWVLDLVHVLEEIEGKRSSLWC